jgi:hypothetical protein
MSQAMGIAAIAILSWDRLGITVWRSAPATG